MRNKVILLRHVVLLNEGSCSSRLHNPVPLPLHFLFSALSSISTLGLITICFTWRQGLGPPLKVQSHRQPMDVYCTSHTLSMKVTLVGRNKNDFK